MATAVPAPTKAKQQATKPAKVKDGVDEMVLQWFAEFNRPVTTQGLVDALGSRVTKATCQKSLDALTASTALLCKEIKKAKYYYTDQVKLAESQQMQAPTAPTLQETTQAAPAPSSQTNEDAEIPTESNESSLADLQSQFVELSRERTRLDGALAQANAARTRAEAQRQVAELTAALCDAAAKLQSLQSNTVNDQTLEDWTLLTNRYTCLRKLWRDRKMLCELIVDAVAGDGSPTEIYETCGLTSDREMGVSLDDMNLVGNKKRLRDPPLPSGKEPSYPICGARKA